MSTQAKWPALFLDRDGVLNVNQKNHVKHWSEFTFLPRSLRALQLLSRSQVPIIVITNQAIINRGLVSCADVDTIHRRMIDHVCGLGGRIDRIYCCPHRVDECCSCRKPEPGLLLQAAADLQIDLDHSVFVGDWVSDIVAGQRARCRTILVRSGRGGEAERLLTAGQAPPADAVVDDLLQALPVIFDILPTRDDASRHDPRLRAGKQLAHTQPPTGARIAEHRSFAPVDASRQNS